MHVLTHVQEVNDEVKEPWFLSTTPSGFSQGIIHVTCTVYKINVQLCPNSLIEVFTTTADNSTDMSEWLFVWVTAPAVTIISLNRSYSGGVGGPASPALARALTELWILILNYWWDRPTLRVIMPYYVRMRSADPIATVQVVQLVHNLTSTSTNYLDNTAVGKQILRVARVNATRPHPSWIINLPKFFPAGLFRPGRFLTAGAATVIHVSTRTCSHSHVHAKELKTYLHSCHVKPCIWCSWRVERTPFAHAWS